MEDIERLRFKIAQLRQDKIIYAVEAVAINTAVLIGLFTAVYTFPSGLMRLTFVLCLLIGPGYSLFMGITNFFRLRQVKKLEKQLEKLLEKRK